MKAAYQIAISALLLAVLGLQAVASFGKLHPYWYWPFLSYPMYNNAHYPGDTVGRYRLFATLEDGREIEVPAADLHLSFWQFLQGPVRHIRANHREEVLRYVTAWEKEHDARIKALKLENDPVAVTKDGIADAPVETLEFDVSGRPS